MLGEGNPARPHSTNCLMEKLETMARLGLLSEGALDAAGVNNWGRGPVPRISTMHSIEKRVWPAMVTDSDAPCYLVPIKPRWAQALFDSKAGDSKLFAPPADLLLRFENAYYRKGAHKVPLPQSRVMWYVSASSREPRAMRICAASLVNEVVTGTANELHKEFKHYGVFNLGDLKAMQSEASGRLTAFTFSHTQLFPRPIPYAEMSAFFESRAIRTNNLISPLRLQATDWIDLYSSGFPEGSEE
jgi:hypothetical protein